MSKASVPEAGDSWHAWLLSSVIFHRVKLALVQAQLYTYALISGTIRLCFILFGFCLYMSLLFPTLKPTLIPCKTIFLFILIPSIRHLIPLFMVIEVI